MVYLETLPVAQTIQRRTIRWYAVSWHLSGGTKESHENLQSAEPVTGKKSEPLTPPLHRVLRYGPLNSPRNWVSAPKLILTVLHRWLHEISYVSKYFRSIPKLRWDILQA
jgi:hypothetical protein